MSEKDTELELSIDEELAAAFQEIDDDAETEPVESETELELSDPEPEVESDEDLATEDAPEAEEPEKVFQAPEHWSSDEKAAFASLTPEAQELVLQRDKHFQTGYQERLRSISDIEQAVEPWKQVLAQRGVSTAEAVRVLFAAQAQIERDPVNGILALAQRFGVADQITRAETDDDFADPEVKALRDQIGTLNAQIQQLSQGQQEVTLTRGQQMIDEFANQKDANGELLHPHFEDVVNYITPLVQQGKTLSEAYDEAKWLSPAYRESQLKTKAPVSDLEKARRVKKAKTAARAVKQTGGEDPKLPDEESNRSIADELRVAMEELNQ